MTQNYDYQSEQKRRRQFQAKIALQHTLEGNPDDEVDRISPEEVEAGRLAKVKENESSQSNARKIARRNLKETLSGRPPQSEEPTVKDNESGSGCSNCDGTSKNCPHSSGKKKSTTTVKTDEASKGGSALRRARKALLQTLSQRQAE